jgi:hypothetical protein
VIKTYCTEQNSKAIITVKSRENIYRAEFDNPPVTVRTENTSKKVYLVDTYNDNSMQFRTVFPGGWIWGVSSRDGYAFCTGGTLVLAAGQLGGTNEIDTIYFDETKFTGLCQVPRRYQYFVETTNNKMICAYTSTAFYGWEVEEGFTYSVTCDGCPPGDCKASKAKYPGYVCLDCQELEARLKRTGNKLDGYAR